MKCHHFGSANIFFPLHKSYAGFLLNWDGGTTFTYTTSGTVSGGVAVGISYLNIKKEKID